MRTRKMVELEEKNRLCSGAALSAETKGRVRAEEKCMLRTEYQRDRDRIIHCKAFRRLKHKTQVFIAPEEDHYRTRLTHTLEVAQIARTVARGLCLNEDLTEAIALGHDLGHTPFGHAGEKALNEIFSTGFRHNEQSLRVVDVLENEDKGLNLTWEVRNGILHHTGSGIPETLEGQIIKFADRIAYINHDIDDACRAGIIKTDALPVHCLTILGNKHGERIDTMVRDLIANSWAKERIAMSDPIQQATDQLREYLFTHVYLGRLAQGEEKKARHIIQDLFHFFEIQPLEELIFDEKKDRERTICDYIAGMTDRYILLQYKKYFLPNNWYER